MSRPIIALVIGQTPAAIKSAALLRRAGITTDWVWRGKLKKLLARADIEVAVFESGGQLIVRDMIMRQQRACTLETLACALADAFDGYIDEQCPGESSRSPHALKILELGA